MVVDFEESVFQPNLLLNKLQEFTGRAHHASIDRILKRQKVPRASINNGRGHASYGWSRNDQSDKETYKYMSKNIKENC